MTGHIYIYGEVGKQVTLDTVLKEISPKNSEYIVHVHSPGGDVFEGYAIYNAIKNTGKSITVQIEGVCASIATLIASAGTKIIMNTKSQFMVHNPKITSVSGDHKELRNVAAQLERIKTQLIQSWLGRTSLSEEELSKMYDNETWLTPEQAKDFGFVDEVQEVLKAVAYAKVNISASQDQSVFKVGDKVKVKDEFVHEPAHKGMIMTISEISTPALALKMEDGNIHKWYVDNEIEITNDNAMEDKKTLMNSITKMLNQLFGTEEKPKNMMETLTDGRMIIVPDDPDWVGKPVTLEDGSPLPAGEHELASGKIIVVGDGSTITEVKEMGPPEDNKTEDMEALKKLEAAEARIKELESALEAQSNTAAEAVAKAKSFENKLNVELPTLKAEIDKLKNTTVGDTTPPAKATKLPFGDKPTGPDPLAEFFKNKVRDVRNTD